MNLYIFDCFGVLYEEVATQFFHKHFSKEEAMTIKDKYFVPADLGIYTMDEALLMLSKDYNIDPQIVKDEFLGYLKKKEDVLAFVKELRKEHKTALLSNAAPGAFEKYATLDFDYYFDKAFVSCDLKLAKPDIRIYQKCLEAFKDYEFDNIYFTDDNINNIKVLEGTVIKGILFKDLDDFKKQIGYKK